MKLSLDWLSDFVSFTEGDPYRIAEALTLGVAEVERVEIQGEFLANCVVGRIVTIEDHPNADTLKLCSVETGRGRKRVVCGGTNLRTGMLVAFAHTGARVKWHGGEVQELKKATIRGEESEGMICAAEELGLEAELPGATGRTIVDLGGGFSVGAPLREALGLDDTIFHVDNHSITHRADLFSHTSFARECVALGLGKWKKKPAYREPVFAKDPIPFRCRNDIRRLVPRYLACTMAIDSAGKTPDWMARRLEATGWRPLALPVDITNYVSMEVGMPLHSFDRDDLRGDVHFRTSRKGETIVTLDRQKRELPEGAIVLSDDEGIFDLMGVMGGCRSATKDSTRTIYLHSAVIDPVPVRRTIAAIGYRTEASTVYEKGIPCVTAERGFLRALELFLDLVPGARITSRIESYGNNGKSKPITLSLERTSSILGRSVTATEVKKALVALSFTVNQKPGTKNKTLMVTPPLDRLGDIREPVDLMEEIARVSGFSAFAGEMPAAPMALPHCERLGGRLSRSLKEMGFVQVVRFAFLGGELLRKAGMESSNPGEITNPLGGDLKYMRPSLRPRLLQFAEENMKFAGDALKVFEIGHVFMPRGERLHLSLLVAPKHDVGVKGEPFLVAKGVTKSLLSEAGFEPMWRDGRGMQSPYVHPARRLELLVGGELTGAVYEVHPAICGRFNLPGRAAMATIDLDALRDQPMRERICGEIPEFPSITYDTTVELGPTVEVGPLLEEVRGSHALLRDVRLVDLYRKGPDRQLTFRCTYNARDRTLTEEEVRPVHERVEKALQRS